MTAIGTSPLRCSLEDLDFFSAASHDCTPLHMSATYARATPYGERILFGVSSGLICLGQLQQRTGYVLTRAVLEFRRAMFVGIDYAVEVFDSNPEHAIVKVYDGPQVVLVVTATFQPGSSVLLDDVSSSSLVQVRTEPAHFQATDLLPGLKVEGAYAPVWDLVREMMKRLEITDKGIGPRQIATLMWCSYLVGMELPGRRGLCCKLTVDFNTQWHGANTELIYMARVVAFDPRFDLLTIDAEIRSGGILLANADIQAFAREEVPALTPTSVECLLPRSDLLKGKIALVVGGSRGLGAAMVQALSLQGCTVLVNFLQSEASARQLQDTLVDAPGQIELVQGNASDLEWCIELHSEIIRRYGRLDFLVCSACPPLLPLHLNTRTANRINEYVGKSLALVNVPMATFLNTLAQNRGWNIVISAQLTPSTLSVDWPHFASAKGAIEGLTRVMAVEYGKVSFLIVRPPRMRTELTNTPMSRQGSLAPEHVAIKVVMRLCRSTTADRIEIVEFFS
jgi:NAD(P)-dependent dehydrogenase (short-subunit alcohol dehydrogenase family)